MGDYFAFIDESGNEGMDMERLDVSPTYVVVSLLMNEDEKRKAQTAFSMAKARHFRHGEMKSSAIGPDDTLRTHVLADLLASRFLLFALIVDKAGLRAMEATGFNYPKSFIKNIQQRLYGRVLSEHQNIHVRADRIKNPSFTAEFRRYIEDHNELNLFQQWYYELVDSSSDVFIQAADVIAGTVRKIMESDYIGHAGEVWRQQLRPLVADLRVFPTPRLGLAQRASADVTAEDDAAIERHALSAVQEFIHRQSDSFNSDIRLQVECARTLFTYGYLRNTDEWVSTSLITQRLQRIAEPDDVIQEQKVRNVVGRLRDAGLLIASRKAGGYKIPSCYDDMRCFVERQRATIDPLMHRILVARRAVTAATEGRLDILQDAQFSNLRDALNAGGEWLARDAGATEEVSE